MENIIWSGFYKHIDFNIDYDFYEPYEVKQYDTHSRGLYVQIVQNGLVITPTASNSLTFFAIKPDGTEIFVDAVIEDGLFRVDFPNQALSVAGQMKGELALRGANNEVITKSITVIIEPSLELKGVESTDDFSALQQALSQIAGFAGDIQDVQLFAENIQRAVGNLDDLTTDEKESIVNSINELNDKISNVLGSESLETLLNTKVDKETLGDMSLLATEEKEILVLAINELFANVEEIRQVSDVSTLLPLLSSKADKSTVGNLADLNDFEQSATPIENLVDAINYVYDELVTSLDGISGVNLEGLALSEDLGDKTTLTTTDKTNLVNAINEINAALKTVESVTDVEQLSILLSGKADKSSLGSLSELTTTQKNNLVAAINEVNSKVGDVDLSEVFTLLEGKVSQEDFDLAVSTLQKNIDTIELTPGPKGDPGEPGVPGQPGADGLSAYQIWLNEGNQGTEQDFLQSLEGPQGPPGEGSGGGVDQELIDIVENNKFRVDLIWGKSSDFSYLLANQDLETVDFSNFNMKLPGTLLRDNYIQGISYDMYGMFSGATLPTPPSGGSWEWGLDPDIPDSNFWKWFMNFETFMEISPSSLENMFANATGDVIMLPGLITGEPISARGMFSGAKVNKIDLGHDFGHGINNMSEMFLSVSNPDGGPTEVDLSRLYTRDVTDMSNMFNNSQVAMLDLSSFDTSSVTNMEYMFSNSQATTLDLSSFDTSNVTNMINMFSNSQATTLDLSSFDTSNVTNMIGMFRSSQATTLDLSSFDTSNVTNMIEMFRNSQATTLDLSSFDTSNVTNMGSMFAYSKATTLDLSSFDTSKVTGMNRMFQEAQATTGYARTQADADRFNASLNKPSGLNFVVHPDLV